MFLHLRTARSCQPASEVGVAREEERNASVLSQHPQQVRTPGLIAVAIMFSPSPPPQTVEASTWCANEGQRCLFSGTADVWYGFGSRGVTERFTNGVDCNNSVFGDPAPGERKACFYTLVSGGGGGGGGGGGADFTWCANEGQRCLFSGTSDVWYGYGSRSVTRRFTDGVDCNNSVFGDPAPGQVKACFQRPVTVAPQPPPGNPPPSTPSCSPTGDQIGLYVHTQYGGECVVKGVGQYPNAGAIGLPNDSISSIKVGANVRAILCQHTYYGGTCETFTADDADLRDNAIGNDQVSSVRVELRGVAPPPSTPSWSVSLTASATTVSGGTSVTLTAQANRNVSGTPYLVAIVAGNNGIVCYTGDGTSCSGSVSGNSGTSQTFRAFVFRDNRSDVQATSNQITVAWTGSSGNPPPSTPSCSPTGDQIGLYVHTQYGGECVVKGVGQYPNPSAIGLPNDSISSIKVGANVRAILCQHTYYGSTCETFTADDADLRDNAIGNDQVSSVRVELRGVAPPPSTPSWSVSLTASATTVSGGTPVTLTAQANRDVGPTPYYLRILASNNAQVVSCGYGASCTGSVSGSGGTSQTYRAVIDNGRGGEVQATSNQVTVNWTTGQAAPPTTGEGFPPEIHEALDLLDRAGVTWVRNTLNRWVTNISFVDSNARGCIADDARGIYARIKPYVHENGTAYSKIEFADSQLRRDRRFLAGWLVHETKHALQTNEDRETYRSNCEETEYQAYREQGRALTALFGGLDAVRSAQGFYDNEKRYAENASNDNRSWFIQYVNGFECNGRDYRRG